jgi:hypothetical protein
MSADAKTSDPKPRDPSARLGKDADEAKEEAKPRKEKPGQDSQSQRVISFDELRLQKKKAQNALDKELKEGQVEIS